MARAHEGGRADGFTGLAVVQPRDCTVRRWLSAFGAGSSTDVGRHSDSRSLREHRRHRRRVCRASARRCWRNYHHKRHVSCRTSPSHHRICHALSAADDLRCPDLCAERGVNLLRGRLSGYPSARRIICRSHPAWCAAWRLAGSGTSQIHPVDQSQGCTSNRSRPAAVAHYSCRRGDRMRRREFVTLLSAVTVGWPLTARAQQAAVPVIGFLDPRSPDAMTDRLRAFRLGLKDVGYVEGENVTIIYRFAEDQNERLPEMAAELVRRQVTVIAASA